MHVHSCIIINRYMSQIQTYFQFCNCQTQAGNQREPRKVLGVSMSNHFFPVVSNDAPQLSTQNPSIFFFLGQIASMKHCHQKPQRRSESFDSKTFSDYKHHYDFIPIVKHRTAEGENHLQVQKGFPLHGRQVTSSHRIVLRAATENSKLNQRCFLYAVIKGNRKSQQIDGDQEI